MGKSSKVKTKNRMFYYLAKKIKIDLEEALNLKPQFAGTKENVTTHLGTWTPHIIV